MFGLGGFETVLIGWLYCIIIVVLTTRSSHPLVRLLPSGAGLLLLVVAYWLAPWLYFNPQYYLFNYFDPVWSEIAAEAGISLIDWFGPDAVKNILTATAQLFSLNAPVLAVVLPVVGLSLRILLGVILPTVMFIVTMRLFAEGVIAATNAQVERLRKSIALAQVGIASIVFILLLWAIPEIDAWGYPFNTDAALAVLALSPEIGPGPWLTVTALILIIGGGVYEALSDLEPTYHSKNKGLLPNQYTPRRERVRADNAKSKRRYR